MELNTIEVHCSPRSTLINILFNNPLFPSSLGEDNWGCLGMMTPEQSMVHKFMVHLAQRSLTNSPFFTPTLGEGIRSD